MVVVESSTSDGEVEQDDEGQLDELYSERDAVRAPAQLNSVEQQTTDACFFTRRELAVSLPQTTGGVDQNTEQHRSRHEPCTVDNTDTSAPYGTDGQLFTTDVYTNFNVTLGPIV